MFSRFTFCVITTILLLPSLLSAQFDGAPDLISFQGMLTDNANEPVPDNTYSIMFTLYDASVGGNTVWVETQNVTTENGIYNVALGASSSLNNLSFNKNLWLGVKVGSDSEMVPRTLLVSVPFALGLRNLRIKPETDDDGPNMIGGYSSNSVTSSSITGATISGGGDPSGPLGISFPNRVSGNYGTVSGGGGNTAGPSSTVGGGFFNEANGLYTTVGGGNTNRADNKSTIGGGEVNTADGTFSTIGGGNDNTASNTNTTIGGGEGNTASGSDATVGGGNTNSASGNQSTVSGGINNTALGTDSTVGGGNGNDANTNNSTIAGGDNNTVSGFHGTVGGGVNNTAGGICSVVAGGCNVSAFGDYSFAAGYNATAQHEGSFVFSDRSSETGLTSTAPNQFLVRAAGGLEMITDPASTTGVRLMPGSGSWQSASSVVLKTDFEVIDPVEVLEGVVRLDVRRWRYKREGEEIRHLGPTSEVFSGLFGLGGSDASIATVDADGVALAAIQGLYRKLLVAEQVIQNGERENRQLKQQLDDQDRRLAEQNERLEQLERMMRHTANQ